MDRKKDEANHKTFEVLSILACFLFTIGVLAWGLELPNPTTSGQRVRQHAEILGYSLWQLELNKTLIPESVSPKSGRGLASAAQETGAISRDLWGHSFAYSFRRDQQLLFVWSLGPDGKNDSSLSLPTFQGDDLGVILDLKLKQ